jgi:hypothetical protein
MGDHADRYFLDFSKYESVTDESIRDYMRYFATKEATSEVTKNIQSKVDFYHNDPKTRSGYMTFKDMLDNEREEGRAEGRVEGIAEESGLTVEKIKAL